MLRFQMIVPESRMGKRIHTGSEKTTPRFAGGLECVRPGLAAGAGGRGWRAGCGKRHGPGRGRLGVCRGRCPSFSRNGAKLMPVVAFHSVVIQSPGDLSLCGSAIL